MPAFFVVSDKETQEELWRSAGLWTLEYYFIRITFHTQRWPALVEWTLFHRFLQTLYSSIKGKTTVQLAKSYATDERGVSNGDRPIVDAAVMKPVSNQQQ